MKTRILFDLLCIVVIYALFGLLAYAAAIPDYQVLEALEIYAPIEGDVAMDREIFYEEVEARTLLVVLVSFVAALAWYVIGEWGPRPHAIGSGMWRVIWLVIGALVLVGTFLTSVWEWAEPSLNAHVLLIAFFGSGLLFYYLATMLFSPVPVKFIVPGSKLFRRW